MSELFEFRPAEAGDVSDIQDLTRLAYAPWVGVIGREPLPMSADYAAAVRDHLIELAHREGNLCGLIEMVREPESLLIENLAVAPEQQGRGLGTILLRRADKCAAQLGLPMLRLYTNQAFQSNISFYERFGFAVERTEAFMGGRTVYMRKSVGD